MTPALIAKIAKAYERHEKAAGGHGVADEKACLAMAAEECGVDVDEARSAMIHHWFGTLGAG